MRCARGEGSASPCCTNGISHSYSPYTCFIKRLLELGLARNFLREAPFRPACTHDCDLRPGYQRRSIVWAAIIGERKVSLSEDHVQAERRRTAWRTRYALLGGAALVAAGLIVWRFWDGRGDLLKPDGGPLVTVMDFGRSFPLDPLPSGWKHQKFWTRTPMTMAFTVKDGVPSMRFETHDSGSMLFRHVDIDLASYPMLAWR